MSVHEFFFKSHLEEDEKILYPLHKHFVAILKPFFQITFFGILMPWFLYFTLLRTSAGFWLALVWFLLAIARFAMLMMDWWSDVLLVTNQCVIVIEWKSLFDHSGTRVDYSEIEGVAYRINGFFPMVFGYGELTLKVSSGNNFVIYPARKPKQAEMEIAKHQQAFLNGREKQDADQLKTLLSSMVARHFSQR